jgi:hypothetical protein
MQTKETGASAALFGKLTAQGVALSIGAKILPTDGRLPKSNFYMFRGQPTGIKIASAGNHSFLLYSTLLKKTKFTVFAFEQPKTLWNIYCVRSSVIPKYGRRAAHLKHLNAWQITRAKVAEIGDRLKKRGPLRRKVGLRSTTITS